MPPQPLNSKRSRNVQIALDPIALRRNCNLAGRIADVIAYWSRIESVLGTILGRMLGTQAEASIAMYQAIRNGQTQMAVLEAAAKVALSEENLKVFRPLMAVVREIGNRRHKCAHWLWGECVEFPDCLILVDPDAIHENNKKMSEYLAALDRGESPAYMPAIDPKKAFIWEEKDFSELVDTINDAYHLALRFSGLVSLGGKRSSPGDDALRSLLLRAPQIQEILRRRRKPPPDAQ